ncbi:MAG TPA: hypothetical protein EYN66_14385 [Myxococcales bacterium]|nr:hypothetical protein [Myxococcales bacterium]
MKLYKQVIILGILGASLALLGCGGDDDGNGTSEAITCMTVSNGCEVCAEITDLAALNAALTDAGEDALTAESAAAECTSNGNTPGTGNSCADMGYTKAAPAEAVMPKGVTITMKDTAECAGPATDG